MVVIVSKQTLQGLEALHGISTEEATVAHETKPQFTFEQFPPTPAGREEMGSYMQVLRQLYDKTGGSELVDASGLVHAVISSGCLEPL